MARSVRARPSGTRNSSARYCPDEGDIVWRDFHPQKGREQKGRRPALVLSPRRYNELAQLCFACPITSRVKNYPFEVALPKAGAVSGGVILADQVKSLSWVERRAELAGIAARPVLLDVRAKIKALLQIS